MGKKQGGRSSAKRRRTDGAGAADGVPISTSASPAAVPGSVAAAQAAIVAAGPEKGVKQKGKEDYQIDIYACGSDGRPRAKAGRQFGAGEVVASFPFARALSVQSAPDAVLEAVEDALALAMANEIDEDIGGDADADADAAGEMRGSDDDLEDDIDWGQGDGGVFGASTVDLRLANGAVETAQHTHARGLVSISSAAVETRSLLRAPLCASYFDRPVAASSCARACVPVMVARAFGCKKITDTVFFSSILSFRPPHTHAHPCTHAHTQHVYTWPSIHPPASRPRRLAAALLHLYCTRSSEPPAAANAVVQLDGLPRSLRHPALWPVDGTARKELAKLGRPGLDLKVETDEAAAAAAALLPTIAAMPDLWPPIKPQPAPAAAAGGGGGGTAASAAALAAKDDGGSGASASGASGASGASASGGGGATFDDHAGVLAWLQVLIAEVAVETPEGVLVLCPPL